MNQKEQLTRLCILMSSTVAMINTTERALSGELLYIDAAYMSNPLTYSRNHESMHIPFWVGETVDALKYTLHTDVIGDTVFVMITSAQTGDSFPIWSASYDMDTCSIELGSILYMMTHLYNDLANNEETSDNLLKEATAMTKVMSILRETYPFGTRRDLYSKDILASLDLKFKEIARTTYVQSDAVSTNPKE